MTESDDHPKPEKQDKKRRPRRWRLVLIAAGIAGLLIMLGLFLCWYYMIFMPGESYAGPIPQLADEQIILRDQLRQDVDQLAYTIGERNFTAALGLNQAADYVTGQFEAAGYQVQRHEYEVYSQPCYNLEVEITGTTKRDEIVVIGAHYDSAPGTPGANDNASGTAALLALARHFANHKPQRTLRFVAFPNEEPPFFQTEYMGSLVYAKLCSDLDENIVAAISIETIGYYSDEPDTQKYPAVFSSFYPSTGNFIAVVGNVGSRPLVLKVIDSFRRHAKFPSEAGAVPGDIEGVGFSDHWSFWQHGYQAVMITDTAPFRYPYYHLPEDTPDKLNFDHMARVVDGLKHVISDLTKAE